MTDPRIENADVEGNLLLDESRRLGSDDFDRSRQWGHAFIEREVNVDDYDETTLEFGEADAACHWLVTRRTRQAGNESLGAASADYQGDFGEGLNSTTYGQALLETFPELRDKDKPTASITVPRTKDA